MHATVSFIFCVLHACFYFFNTCVFSFLCVCVCVAGGRPPGEAVLLSSAGGPEEEDRVHRHHQRKLDRVYDARVENRLPAAT